MWTLFQAIAKHLEQNEAYLVMEKQNKRGRAWEFQSSKEVSTI